MSNKKHHWKIKKGEKIDPSEYFGFIYLITNKETGKMYIGKKQYWMKRPAVKGCKSASCTDRQSPKWKHKCWKESDWRTYTGSSKDLNKDIQHYKKGSFKFQILKQCRSRATLYYSEVEEQVFQGCLWRQNDKGEALFYNKQIAAVKFKPAPFLFQAEEKLGCRRCSRKKRS